MISSLCTRLVKFQSNYITRCNSFGQSGVLTEGRISHFASVIRSKPEGRIGLFRAEALHKWPPSTVKSPDASAATAMSTTTSRLKREDHRRTKHDSAFSPWKVLIAASDWKDHATGKEGAERYRTQNLPNCVSCPGVYELGIAAILHSARASRKLDSTSVVPVYLGQAENVRTRLQRYGRDGAHLDNGCSHDDSNDRPIVSSNKGLDLFSEIFSKDRAIVYRFAPMKSKKDAELTESKLLDKFDYAWNKEMNGARRKDDVLKALYRLEKPSLFSHLAMTLFTHQKQVGIKIRSCEPHMSKNGSNLASSGNNLSFSRILRIKRLQPEPVRHGYGDDCTEICGVAVGQGSVCTKPPVKGRKRCAEHKGMRLNGCTAKFNPENTSTTPSGPPMGSGIVSDQDCAEIQNQRSSLRTSAHQTPTGDQSPAPTCGVAICYGSICTMPPVKGRKRCAAHKGMRVNAYIPKSNAEGKKPSIIECVTPGLYS